MAGITNDRAILHLFKVLAIQNKFITSHRAKDVTLRSCFSHGHNPEAIHQCLKRGQRVNLGNNHIRTHASSPPRQTFAAPAVARHHKALASQQNISRTHNAIQRALPGAIAIVKQMFGQRIIHRNHREL